MKGEGWHALESLGPFVPPIPGPGLWHPSGMGGAGDGIRRFALRCDLRL